MLLFESRGLSAGQRDRENLPAIRHSPDRTLVDLNDAMSDQGHFSAPYVTPHFDASGEQATPILKARTAKYQQTSATGTPKAMPPTPSVAADSAKMPSSAIGMP